MTETIDPTKPKRVTRIYSPEDRFTVMRLSEEGKIPTDIARDTGLPLSTVYDWIAKSGTADVRGRIHKSVSQIVRQAVDRAKTIAGAEVDRLIAEQLSIGNLVMVKARTLINACTGLKHASILASAANSAKIGVGLSRQALGLNDTTEKVIVRVDLIGRAEQQPERPAAIDVTPQPIVVGENNSKPLIASG